MRLARSAHWAARRAELSGPVRVCALRAAHCALEGNPATRQPGNPTTDHRQPTTDNQQTAEGKH